MVLLNCCLLFIAADWPAWATGPCERCVSKWDIDGDGDADLRDWAEIVLSVTCESCGILCRCGAK